MQAPNSSVMPSGDQPPFFYASFAGLWVYYLVPLNVLNNILTFTANGFTPYDFGGGMGLANLNFMNYAGHSGSNDPQAYLDILKPVSPPSGPYPASLGVEGSNECEFNIVVAPTARSAQTPVGMSVADYIAGKDHTKTIGNFRVGVPCDDRIAVYWGTCNYGENKIMTHPFMYNVPSPNNPAQTAWQFIVPGMVSEAFTFDMTNFNCNPFMFSMVFDASNVTPTVSNASEIIDYSLFSENQTIRPVGSRRNLFGIFNAYDLTTTPPKAATLSIGNSTQPLAGIIGLALGQKTPVAAQTFQSQPVIAESSMYYVDL